LIALLLLLGCGPETVDRSDTAVSTPSEQDTAGDFTTTSTPTTTPTTDGDGLLGIRLDPPIPLVAFSVLNQDGVERTDGWLRTGPSVVWFYRDAATAG